MLREHLVEHDIATEDGFRTRGREVSRIEGFSDAVLAFAITLLVVSLEVPKTFDELLEAMRGFLAFAVCFALLIQVWGWHYRFFRRYGLQDRVVIALNAALLFVVLFYVYPLKFLFTLLIDQLLGRETTVASPGGPIERIREEQAPTLMVIYGAGFLAVNLVFALLYAHAWRRRGALELDESEALGTRESIERHLLFAGVAAISIAIAVIGGPDATGLAGFSYFLIAPAMTAHGFIRGARQRKLRAAARPDGPR